MEKLVWTNPSDFDGAYVLRQEGTYVAGLASLYESVYEGDIRRYRFTASVGNTNWYRHLICATSLEEAKREVVEILAAEHKQQINRYREQLSELTNTFCLLSAMQTPAEKPGIFQKISFSEASESICPKCDHRGLCLGEENQVCIECSRFSPIGGSV